MKGLSLIKKARLRLERRGSGDSGETLLDVFDDSCEPWSCVGLICVEPPYDRLFAVAPVLANFAASVLDGFDKGDLEAVNAPEAYKALRADVRELLRAFE